MKAGGAHSYHCPVVQEGHTQPSEVAEWRVSCDGSSAVLLYLSSSFYIPLFYQVVWSQMSEVVKNMLRGF